MRLPVLLVAGALALTACSGGTPDERPTAEADSTGGKPQLAIARTCYASCTPTSPLGLPEVAVYADGRVVAVDRSGAGSRPVLRGTRLDAARLDRLQEAALAAGLADGDRSTLPLRAAGPPTGGGTVVTVRLRATLTRLEVPYLDATRPEPGRYADAERYGRVVALVKALQEVAAEADDPAPAGAHVVQARPLRAAGSAVPRPWPGPPLRSLPVLEADLRCGVLTGAAQQAAAPAVEASGFPGTYRDGGRLWGVVGRPMLPHEQTCSDVRDSTLAARAAGPRFPGDRRA